MSFENKHAVIVGFVTVAVLFFCAGMFVNAYDMSKKVPVLVNQTIFEERERACIAAMYDTYDMNVMEMGACVDIDEFTFPYYAEYPLFIRAGIFNNFADRSEDLEQISCVIAVFGNESVSANDKGLSSQQGQYACPVEEQ